jgi:hypothetical protein
MSVRPTTMRRRPEEFVFTFTRTSGRDCLSEAVDVEASRLRRRCDHRIR